VPLQPIAAPVGEVNEVLADIRTGGDDLRGGNDNLNITIYFKNGDKQVFNNVNHSSRWADNTNQVVMLRLKRPMRPEDITQVSLMTTSRGSLGGDNWNMDSITIRAQ
jgi:hypothetical protein